MNKLKNSIKNIDRFVSNASNILVLSHLDADGLSSGGLLCHYLLKKDKSFTSRVVKQFEEPVLKTILKSENDLVIFVDMGSGQLRMVKEIIESEKKVIVIDHHQISGGFKDEKFIHINLGEDNPNSISGSGTTYLVVKNLDKSFEKYAYLALVGAEGDNQTKNGFIGYNKIFLNYCLDNNIVKKKKGLNVYGRFSKPIHEVLVNSNFDIPGVTNNESGCIQFLSKIGIGLKKDDEWITLSDLSKEDYEKLISKIIIKRNNNGLDNNIFKEYYEINNKKSILKSLVEWSTVLNACGRMGKGEVGLLINMGFEKKGLRMAREIIKEYKVLIGKSMSWVFDNKESDKIFRKDDIVFINGEDNIPDSVIGTICSIIISRNDFFDNMRIIVGFAQREDEDIVKVSCRAKKESGINLGEIVNSICLKNNWQGGGHSFAAGAVIDENGVQDFIKEFISNKEKV